jgi:hypothetical protein
MLFVSNETTTYILSKLPRYSKIMIFTKTLKKMKIRNENDLPSTKILLEDYCEINVVQL